MELGEAMIEKFQCVVCGEPVLPTEIIKVGNKNYCKKYWILGMGKKE